MAEQKKPTSAGAPVRKRKSAAKTASPAATVTGRADVPAKAPKRKQAETKAAPLFDAPIEAANDAVPAPVPPAIVAPQAKPAEVQAFAPLRLADAGETQARDAFARAQGATAALRQVVAESTTATTAGALEVNEKVLDAFRAQSEAVLDLWRSTLAADTLTEAVRVQTTGARDAYAVAASHWKDVAESTSRWFGAALKPFQSVLTNRGS
jgi:hypothetical protein